VAVTQHGRVMTGGCWSFAYFAENAECMGQEAA